MRDIYQSCFLFSNSGHLDSFQNRVKTSSHHRSQCGKQTNGKTEITKAPMKGIHSILRRVLILGIAILTVASTTRAQSLRSPDDPRDIEFFIEVTNNNIGTTNTALHLNVSSGVPQYYTVQESDPKYGPTHSWIPWTTSNITVNLGTNEGLHEFWVGLKGALDDGSIRWVWKQLDLHTRPPPLTITSPTNGTVDVPMIQLMGYSPVELETISYVLSNSSGTVTGGQLDGRILVNPNYDMGAMRYTSCTFQAYDVTLAKGVNTFTLHATDLAGNVATLVTNITFDNSAKTEPPGFKLDSPQDGQSLSGSEYDLRGPSDDPTADVTALVCNDEGKSTRLKGAIERNSYLWVEHIPVMKGRNFVTVITTDAANNSSLTNIMITKAAGELYMDPVADPQQLWQPSITITGFSSRPDRPVTVNGVTAKMNPDGHWVATGVPVNSPNGGTATFDIKSGSDDGDDDVPTNSWVPAVWSHPDENESLSAGISMPSAGTNEYNHYRVYLGFTNTSGQRIPNLTWMLPREESRFNLHLYDQTGREVGRGGYMLKFGQPLVTNVNIHHLGESELANFDGIIDFPSNSTVRVADLNLDQYFPLTPPGQYRLEAGLRLYKIAGDGRLVPFEFPAVSLLLQVIDQPSEMAFYLKDIQRQGRLIWGAERYGLRLGVVHTMESSRIGNANQIEIFTQNVGANDYRDWVLRLPPQNEQFDMTLYDVRGKEVHKTGLGNQMGQPLSLDGRDLRKTTSMMDGLFGNNASNIRRLRPINVAANDAAECGQFNLNDYFEIKTPGKYELKYQQRFYRRNTNSVLTGIMMPWVTVPLVFTNVPGK
ncbi:MAG TPA: Ig-like domain-containing protein [Candidatus Acidoferrales bacterium]|nr:Ig-like domain-containing protein [Candidatus Acidoferrales bacterium]